MRTLLLALFLSVQSFAADPITNPVPVTPPTIRLPKLEPAKVIVAPSVEAGSKYKLNGKQYFIIDSDVEVFPLSFPPGMLKYTVEEGPIKIKAEFVDSNGIEPRVFKGKFVYQIEAVDGAKGDTELAIVPKGVMEASKIQRYMVEVNGPAPPPKPTDPDIKPGPKPDGTSPFAEAGNRCLIIFDSANTTRPAAQNAILFGKAVRDLLNERCVEGPTNEKDGAGKVMKEWRIYPANSDVSLARPVFKNAFAKKGGSDWIMLGNGTTGYSGPLPANETEAVALIKKHLGGN